MLKKLLKRNVIYLFISWKSRRPNWEKSLWYQMQPMHLVQKLSEHPVLHLTKNNAAFFYIFLELQEILFNTSFVGRDAINSIWDKLK